MQSILSAISAGNLYLENLDRCIDAPVGNGIALGFQYFVAAFFYGVFAFSVDDHAALLSLFLCMAAYIYQGFYHPFKCIHLIVPYDQ